MIVLIFFDSAVQLHHDLIGALHLARGRGTSRGHVDVQTCASRDW
jgi:hypothetical protein